MKYLSAMVVLLGFCGFHAGQGVGPADLDKMQGVWLVMSLVEKGKAAPAGDIDILEVAITKNKLGVFEKGKLLIDYTIKIDPSRTLKVIDFTHQSGEFKGKTEPGIYAFEKGQLKLMVFEGKDTLSHSTIVLKKKTK